MKFETTMEETCHESLRPSFSNRGNGKPAFADENGKTLQKLQNIARKQKHAYNMAVIAKIRVYAYIRGENMAYQVLLLVSI